MNSNQFESIVRQTIKKYKLFSPKDKIVVALSGGKDSSTVAHLLKKFGYKFEGLYIDLGMKGYSDKCYEKILEPCKELNIKLHVYEVQKELGGSMCYIRTNLQNSSQKGLKNCAICGVIKKWILNKKARELGFDKIVTGHNLDDEAQTVIVNFLKGSLELGANAGPKPGQIQDKKFVQRVKPLFFSPEKSVREYAIKNKIPFHPSSCPCAIDSMRIQTRKWLRDKPEKIKLNVVNNFLSQSKNIQTNASQNKTLKYCIKCGEPSRNELCRMCRLFEK